jgi:hypothetical protein
MLLEMTTGATVEIPNSPSDTPICEMLSMDSVLYGRFTYDTFRKG